MKANILGFDGVVLSVVDDIFVDSKTSVVTLSILRICQRSVFEDAHEDRVCVCAFIGMNVRAL